MSGGALNYFYHHDVGVQYIWAIDLAIEFIEANVSQYNDNVVYQQLLELKQSLLQAKKITNDLQNVLHDIEWAMSGDYSCKEVAKSIEEYK